MYPLTHSFVTWRKYTTFVSTATSPPLESIKFGMDLIADFYMTGKGSPSKTLDTITSFFKSKLSLAGLRIVILKIILIYTPSSNEIFMVTVIYCTLF